MIKKNYELEILVNNKPIQEYFHDNKVYVEGRKDTTFSIKLKNNSVNKVLFIPTIDGLSIIDGKDASFESSGYIINGRSTITINGWRISDEQIAEFYFSSVNDSYRKRKGTGNNLGSIAVAVFREKEKNYQKSFVFTDDTGKPWIPKSYVIPSPPVWYDNSCTAAMIANSAMIDNPSSTALCANTTQDVGTGFGDIKDSVITTISFEKENEPDSILEMFYNTKKQLYKMGVTFTKRQMVISQQNSFPNENRYCKRPRN